MNLTDLHYINPDCNFYIFLPIPNLSANLLEKAISCYLLLLRELDIISFHFNIQIHFHKEVGQCYKVGMVYWWDAVKLLITNSIRGWLMSSHISF